MKKPIRLTHRDIIETGSRSVGFFAGGLYTLPHDSVPTRTICIKSPLTHSLTDGNMGEFVIIGSDQSIIRTST